MWKRIFKFIYRYIVRYRTRHYLRHHSKLHEAHRKASRKRNTIRLGEIHFVIFGIIIITPLINTYSYGQNIPCPAFETRASWYSEESCKKEGTSGYNADGTKFIDSDFSCASWDLPFNTYLLVTNKFNNKSVIVIVKDRGPARKLYNKGRKLDLSRSAFKSLDKLSKGVIEVKVEVLP